MIESEVYTLTEAVNYCLQKGFSVTKQNLRQRVNKDKNIFKNSSCISYEPKIYENELDVFILSRKGLENHIKLSDLISKYDLIQVTVYSHIRRGVLKAKRLSRGNIYVSAEEAERYLRRYRKHYQG